MKERLMTMLVAGALGAGFLVYREVANRARLLADLLRSDDYRDQRFDDHLVAYAEPSTLPKALFRRKAS